MIYTICDKHISLHHIEVIHILGFPGGYKFNLIFSGLMQKKTQSKYKNKKAPCKTSLPLTLSRKLTIYDFLLFPEDFRKKIFNFGEYEIKVCSLLICICRIIEVYIFSLLCLIYYKSFL